MPGSHYLSHQRRTQSMQLLCLKFIIYDLTPLKLCFKLIHPAGLRCNDHFRSRQSQRLSFPKDIILRTMGSVEEQRSAHNCHTRPLPPHSLPDYSQPICFHSSPSCVLCASLPEALKTLSQMNALLPLNHGSFQCMPFSLCSNNKSKEETKSSVSWRHTQKAIRLRQP